MAIYYSFEKSSDSFSGMYCLCICDNLMSENDSISADMWHQIWMWCFLSNLITHTIATVIAFVRLRRHKIGRFVPALIFAAGVLFSITGGVITS